MSPISKALRSRRVVTPAGVRAATIFIGGETIAAVAPFDAPIPAGCALEDYGDAVVSPGAIDAHVHINEPGRTEWEGFASATRSALAGGVTSLVEMPLNATPVVTDRAAWNAKIAATKGKLHCDCGFYGGLVPGNADQIEAMLDAGALGIKAFLVHSGLDEFPAAREADLRAAMPMLARHGAPLLVHAELEGEAGVVPPVASAPATSSRSYSAYLASRPPAWEICAIAWMIDLCREFECRVHIVHLASAAALPLLRAARAEGLPLTVETAPHYLTFAAENIADGATQFKCAPPIRDKANREALWQGLREGTIDFVASDHSPCPPHLKHLECGDFGEAWGGISSLQWTPALVWTEASERGFGVEDVARWTSANPAHFLGLHAKKGTIAVGLDADFAVWEPEASFVVGQSEIYHRHKVTPYAGVKMMGRVRATWLRGQKVFSEKSNHVIFAGREGRVLYAPR